MGLVVLGCRTSSRRSEAGARTFLADASRFACVVASGGRAWATQNGGARVVEADVIAQVMIDRGVPSDLVVRERCSHSTRENAAYSARILARRGITRVVIVTSEWHVPRARRHFETAGLEVEAAAVATTQTAWTRFLTTSHERAAAILDRIVR